MGRRLILTPAHCLLISALGLFGSADLVVGVEDADGADFYGHKRGRIKVKRQTRNRRMVMRISVAVRVSHPERHPETSVGLCSDVGFNVNSPVAYETKDSSRRGGVNQLVYAPQGSPRQTVGVPCTHSESYSFVGFVPGT